MFAKEPTMYVDKTYVDRYGFETHNERAEKLNGRAAMLGVLLDSFLCRHRQVLLRNLLMIASMDPDGSCFFCFWGIVLNNYLKHTDDFQRYTSFY